MRRRSPCRSRRRRGKSRFRFLTLRSGVEGSPTGASEPVDCRLLLDCAGCRIRLGRDDRGSSRPKRRHQAITTPPPGDRIRNRRTSRRPGLLGGIRTGRESGRSGRHRTDSSPGSRRSVTHRRLRSYVCNREAGITGRPFRAVELAVGSSGRTARSKREGQSPGRLPNRCGAGVAPPDSCPRHVGVNAHRGPYGIDPESLELTSPEWRYCPVGE